MVARAFRPQFAVTIAVWKALFLREALYRLFGSRAAWAWLLLEPIVHIAILMAIFTVIRMRVVGGIDTPLWLLVGLLSFFMFKRTAMQSMNAVGANQALFAYRQVKPVDTVLTRASLEGFLMILITFIIATGAGLMELVVAPGDPLAVMEAFFGMWLMGMGFGLVTSVVTELLPEVGRIIGMLMMPLYLFSGVIIPISGIPSPYHEWLMLNPLAHGVDAARLGFAPYYNAAPEVSIGYLYGCAVGTIFLGLVLHARHEMSLVAK